MNCEWAAKYVSLEFKLFSILKETAVGLILWRTVVSQNRPFYIKPLALQRMCACASQYLFDTNKIFSLQTSKANVNKMITSSQWLLLERHLGQKQRQRQTSLGRAALLVYALRWAVCWVRDRRGSVVFYECPPSGRTGTPMNPQPPVMDRSASSLWPGTKRKKCYWSISRSR